MGRNPEGARRSLSKFPLFPSLRGRDLRRQCSPAFVPDISVTKAPPPRACPKLPTDRRAVISATFPRCPRLEAFLVCQGYVAWVADRADRERLYPHSRDRPVAR